MRLDQGISLEVGEGVYDPSDDSLLLIDCIEISEGQSVLDMGCGSGIVALHCAKMGAEVTASDVSEGAIACAKANAVNNSLNVNFIESDLFERISGRFDLIAFNPPYLPKDEIDDGRLTGGGSGLEVSKEFLIAARAHLSDGGRILIVVSSLAGNRKFEEFAHGSGYVFRIAGRKKLFFEELFVYELRTAA